MSALLYAPKGIPPGWLCIMFVSGILKYILRLQYEPTKLYSKPKQTDVPKVVAFGLGIRKLSLFFAFTQQIDNKACVCVVRVMSDAVSIIRLTPSNSRENRIFRLEISHTSRAHSLFTFAIEMENGSNSSSALANRFQFFQELKIPLLLR